MIALTEKYKPVRLEQFAGLARPKAILARFAADPGSSAWLFLGPSGVGKTTAALALCEQLGAELHHIPSKLCDLATVEDVVRKCHYMPWAGQWHFVLVDEADQMSHAAQLAFLSKLDSTAAPPNTIFVFTANAKDALEDRFISRCRTIKFEKPEAAEIREYLAGVWAKESDAPAPDLAELDYEANGNIRSALNLLEMELICPRPRKPAPEPVATEPTPVVEVQVKRYAPPARKSWGQDLYEQLRARDLAASGKS